MKRSVVLTTALGAAAAATVAVSPAASASSTGLRPASAGRSSLGVTTVTTAPGIATTLLKAGIAPLPQRGTGLGVSFRNGIQVSYGFPITSSTANLATASGNILHSGGITFVSRKASLAISNFDIDLKAKTVYATKVNGAAAKVATLNLDLSKLEVTKTRSGDTVLSGITTKLAPAAASAINSTFKTALPADGSLTFGTASVVLKG